MEEMRELIEVIKAMKDDLDQRHLENIGAQAVTDAKVVEAIRAIDEIRRAFPDGDTAAHRIYHESLIKQIDAKTDFYQKLRLEVTSKGMWALILLLVVALVAYLKASLKS